MTRYKIVALVILLVAAAATACSTDETGTSTGNEGDASIDEDSGDADIGNRDTSDRDIAGDVEVGQEQDTDSSIPDTELIIGPPERPARVLLPDDYDGSELLPVIFLFHGYTATSEIQDAYFELSARRHERQFIAVLPEGLEDSTGQQYWNATDFCCDHYGDEPDDVGYFIDLLDELLERVSADPDRIHLMGHSNGHFFANRLACDHGSRVATVMGLAGGGHWDAEDCGEDGKVSMLHIHGTSDAVILYTGVLGQYPAARTMTDRWAERNDCSDDSAIYDNISVSSVLIGDETTRRHYSDCPEGIDVELWSIVGGSHMPVLEENVTDRILDFALPRTNMDTQ